MNPVSSPPRPSQQPAPTAIMVNQQPAPPAIMVNQQPAPPAIMINQQPAPPAIMVCSQNHDLLTRLYEICQLAVSVIDSIGGLRPVMARALQDGDNKRHQAYLVSIVNTIGILKTVKTDLEQTLISVIENAMSMQYGTIPSYLSLIEGAQKLPVLVNLICQHCDEFCLFFDGKEHDADTEARLISQSEHIQSSYDHMTAVQASWRSCLKDVEDQAKKGPTSWSSDAGE